MVVRTKKGAQPRGDRFGKLAKWGANFSEEFSRYITNPSEAVARFAGHHHTFDAWLASFVIAGLWIFVLLVSLQEDGHLHDKYRCKDDLRIQCDNANDTTTYDTNCHVGHGHDGQCICREIDPDHQEYIRILISIPLYVFAFIMGLPIIMYWWKMNSDGARAARAALMQKGIKDKFKMLKEEFFNPNRGAGMVFHILHMMCLWLAIVLPVLRWDGVITWDWSLALIPFFTLSGTVVVQGWVRAWGGNSVYLNRALGVKAATKDAGTQASGDEYEMDRKNKSARDNTEDGVGERYESLNLPAIPKQNPAGMHMFLPAVVQNNLVRRGYATAGQL